MPQVMKRYDLTPAQEKVIVDYIECRISGAEAARQLDLPHRQGFVNMLASIIQQWHQAGHLNLSTINKK